MGRAWARHQAQPVHFLSEFTVAEQEPGSSRLCPSWQSIPLLAAAVQNLTADHDMSVANLAGA